jgi:hypothetical protein
VNVITVSPQGNGSQIWTNVNAANGETIRYRFVPVASLVPGDRIESVRQFGPKGTTRPDGTGRPLTPPEIAAFPAGSFVRVREEP